MSLQEEKSTGLGFPMFVILMAMVAIVCCLVLLKDEQGLGASRVYLPHQTSQAVASNQPSDQ
jgi:preprotein translocase subunit SecG